MLAVLSDGMPHTKKELHACLDDELSALDAIRKHITNLRMALRPAGQDIVCAFVPPGRRLHYQQVQLLSSTANGTKSV